MKSAEDKSADDRYGDDKSADDKSADDKSAEDKSADDEGISQRKSQLRVGDTVKINYADCKNADVPLKNVLSGLLIDERRNVLFVGEGDFTFTFALAALRVKDKLVECYSNSADLDKVSSVEHLFPRRQIPAEYSPFPHYVWGGICSTRYGAHWQSGRVSDSRWSGSAL